MLKLDTNRTDGLNYAFGLNRLAAGDFALYEGTSPRGDSFGGTRRLYINSVGNVSLQPDSGNVGIGTTSPSVRLSLGGGPGGIKQLLYDEPGFSPDYKMGFGVNLANPGVSSSIDVLMGFGTGADNSFNVVKPTTGWPYYTSTYTNSTFTKLLTVLENGNVGIGTFSPESIQSGGPALHLYGAGPSLRIQDTASNGDWNLFARTGASTNLFRIYDNAHSADRLTIDASGIVNVGVALTVGPAGLIHGNSLNVNGDVTVSGNLAARFQDIAEWVPVTESMTAGTVVVVSNDASNTVAPSLHAYDTGVAGVISAQPGLTLGEGSTTKAKVATTGRVRVRVDATTHPIARGDLLVTSDKPGTAMFSEALDLGGVKIHRPGTLIGKALEPLAKGQGEILVLLSLQ